MSSATIGPKPVSSTHQVSRSAALYVVCEQNCGNTLWVLVAWNIKPWPQPSLTSTCRCARGGISAEASLLKKRKTIYVQNMRFYIHVGFVLAALPKGLCRSLKQPATAYGAAGGARSSHVRSSTHKGKGMPLTAVIHCSDPGPIFPLRWVGQQKNSRK